MLKNKLKILLGGLIALNLFIAPTSVFASEYQANGQSHTSEQTMNYIKVNHEDHYTVKDIKSEDIPQGIEPISFDSQKEANAYFEDTVENINTSKTEKAFPQFTMFMYNGSRHAQKFCMPVTLSIDVPYVAKWNTTWGNYYASASKPTTSISGVTLGYGWRPNDGATYYNIGDDPRTLTAHGAGYLDCYVLIEGAPKVYSEQLTIDGSWGQP